MFQLTDRQFLAFHDLQKEGFVDKCKTFLKDNFPNWCSEHSNEEIEIFIRKMLTFGHEHAINKEINLQRLMYLKIRFNYKIPLDDDIEVILKDDEVGESRRLKKLHQLMDQKYNNGL